MSIILQGPAGPITTTSVLPDPSFDDIEELIGDINRKRSMSNVMYSTIKTTNRSHLQYVFAYLTREKIFEVYAFTSLYYNQQVRLTNHKSEVWFVYIQTTEPSFEYALTDGSGNLTLDFEGFRLA